MLKLERESEIDGAVRARPGAARLFRLNVSFSLRSSREPVLSPARALRAPPRSHAGASVEATRCRARAGPQPNR
ncbi:hypothetical protein GCM10010220_27430 [Streptomyces parvulus]|nr:hypothetical protein GCM10010220_27430 [Streptomyces parvulus]